MDHLDLAVIIVLVFGFVCLVAMVVAICYNCIRLSRERSPIADNAEL